MMITAEQGSRRYGMHSSTIMKKLEVRGHKPWRGITAKLYDENEVAELAEKIKVERARRKQEERQCRQCGKMFRRNKLLSSNFCPSCFSSRQSAYFQKHKDQKKTQQHQPMTDEEIRAWNRAHPFRREGLQQGMNHLSQEENEREIDSAKALKGR